MLYYDQLGLMSSFRNVVSLYLSEDIQDRLNLAEEPEYREYMYWKHRVEVDISNPLRWIWIKCIRPRLFPEYDKMVMRMYKVAQENYHDKLREILSVTYVTLMV